jgi:hypothetical protein
MLDLRTIFDPDRVAPAAVPPFCVIPDDLPPEWHFLWDERAAIMEYNAGLPRERAEALALTDILNLMHNTGHNPQC